VASTPRGRPVLLVAYVTGAIAVAAAVVLYATQTLSPPGTDIALETELSRARQRIALAIVVGFAVTVGAGLWMAATFSRRLTQRVATLTDLSAALVGPQARRRSTTGDVVDRLESNMIAIAENLQGQLRQAQAERHKLEAILSGMAEGLLVIDRQGTIQLVNDRARRLFSAAADEPFAGRPLLALSRDPDLQELVREVTHAGFSGPVMRELSFRTGGDVEILQVNLHDVTALKKMEAMRRDFVANVSHELRTPLTAVHGYAETLQSGALDDPALARKFLRVIERHSERLTRLTDDLLILSDLELGRAALQHALMPMAPSVEAAIEVLRDKAHQSEISIATDLPADLSLWADADRVEQVLVNLIDNAVKYSAAGGRVTISARAVERIRDLPAAATLVEHDVRAWVEIVVADTGVGIPRQDLPRLTERFYRVDKARSRELGGTGLGLAIVKHIVQAHGGALQIESEVGHGTRVHVYLPAEPHGSNDTVA
jgi:two-component system phosphate regulon sensor histidine kinase PhoR